MLHIRNLRSIFFALLACAFLIPVEAHAERKPSLTPEDAYALIPHRRTVFDPKSAVMERADAYRLSEMLALTDEAVVRRVEMLEWLKSKGTKGIPFEKYKQETTYLSSQILALAQVKSLDFAKYFVRQALDEQLLYFEQRARDVARGLPYSHIEDDNGKRNVHLENAHRFLNQAYNQLTQAFPNEVSPNREALYDYIFALDLY